MKQSPFFLRAPAVCRPSRRRRRGVALVYTALFMTTMLGVAGVVVDMGSVYREKQAMQRACDAAALAGAWRLAHPSAVPANDIPDAKTMAEDYAAKNGYDVIGANRVANASKWSVLTYYPAREQQQLPANTTTNPDRTNWYRVTIQRFQPTLFGSIIGRAKVPIIATAVALYSTNAPIDIKGLGTYGSANGIVNLSVFGPMGRFAYGDCYSTRYLNDGVTLNPLYRSQGYDFLVNVPQNMNRPQIEVYDPDCINTVGVNAGSGQIDELRKQDGANGQWNSDGTSPDATTTVYSVYDDNGTPNNPADDIFLDSETYGGSSAADKAANSKWVNLFDDRRSSRSKTNSNYRVNVRSTGGSSENGFDLRAGPRLTGSQTFNPTNGTAIAADGHIPLNFNTSGSITIALGKVPIQAAGGTMKISKFDTDVGAQTITYTCSTLPGMSWSGVLSTDAGFKTDTIDVPTSYTTIGTWYATYGAGQGDTSVWDMSYSNAGPGSPGTIQLIR